MLQRARTSFFSFLLTSLATGSSPALDAGQIRARQFAPASISAHADEIRQVPGFIALADRRLFAVMAFLNASGYDDEKPGTEMPALRVKVRRLLAQNLKGGPEKLEGWRRQYAGNAQALVWLPAYQDYSLRLSPDYPFRPVFPIPHQRLKRFHEVLNDFWRTARVGEIWRAVKLEYLDEVRAYELERMQSEVDALWAYLRMSRSDAFTFVIVPNPLCESWTAQAVHLGAYYYIVNGPRVGRSLNTHEYLHSIVEPIVKVSLRSRNPTVEGYFQASKGKTKYYGTVQNFTSECVIRAVTARLAFKRDQTPERRAAVERQIDSLMDGGFLLLRPFYEALGGFEADALPFREFVPKLLDGIPTYRPRHPEP
jgi:hypothetical protein